MMWQTCTPKWLRPGDCVKGSHKLILLQSIATTGGGQEEAVPRHAGTGR